MSVEKEQIQAGYNDEVKGMFHPFLLDFLLHGPDAAAAKFKDGLAKIMQARDLALGSLPTNAGPSGDAVATSSPTVSKSPIATTAPLITCTPKQLPRELLVPAARTAVEINPLNHPPLERLTRIVPGFQATAERIAVITTKFWHTRGVRLTVGFLDNPPPDLRARLLLHMNAWSATANVKFVETSTDPQVRIARNQGDGYWSYVGTDILSIAPGQPTMNLDSFSMQTPESEYHRVVRHETGHTLGCPHEHMRKELVDKIDPDKAIAYFEATQGWTAEEVRQQVLTPLDDSTLTATPHADPNSIMCYQIPGSITKDGQPIIGGLDIDSIDYAFMATIYPKLSS